MKKVIKIDDEIHDKLIHPAEYDMSVGETYDVIASAINAIDSGIRIDNLVDEKEMLVVIKLPISLYANRKTIQNGSAASKRILECVKHCKKV